MLFPNSKKSRVIKPKIKLQPGNKESFGSNELLKQETINDYLRMTFNTILELEASCR
jgi:hypothetical protein